MQLAPAADHKAVGALGLLDAQGDVLFQLVE